MHTHWNTAICFRRLRVSFAQVVRSNLVLSYHNMRFDYFAPDVEVHADSQRLKVYQNRFALISLIFFSG